MDEWVDLGWENGWREKPDIVVQCQQKGHVVYRKDDFERCVHVVWCEICRYTYSWDSSD